jgi:hypothetical protein
VGELEEAVAAEGVLLDNVRAVGTYLGSIGAAFGSFPRVSLEEIRELAAGIREGVA